MRWVQACEPNFTDIQFQDPEQAWVFYVFGYSKSHNGVELVAATHARLELEPLMKRNVVRIWGEATATWL